MPHETDPRRRFVTRKTRPFGGIGRSQVGLGRRGRQEPGAVPQGIGFGEGLIRPPGAIGRGFRPTGGPKFGLRTEVGGPKAPPRRRPGGPGPQPGEVSTPYTPPGIGEGLPPFLPATPEYEALRRAAEDELTARLAGITSLRDILRPQAELEQARLGTEKSLATEALNEALVGRGIFGSGLGQQTLEQEVELPFGRAYQDIGLRLAEALAGLGTQEGEAHAEYNRDLMEALLDRAAQVSQEQPLGLPTFPAGLVESIQAALSGKTTQRPPRTKPKRRPNRRR